MTPELTALLETWRERGRESYHAHAWVDAVAELEQALAASQPLSGDHADDHPHLFDRDGRCTCGYVAAFHSQPPSGDALEAAYQRGHDEALRDVGDALLAQPPSGDARCVECGGEWPCTISTEVGSHRPSGDALKNARYSSSPTHGVHNHGTEDGPGIACPEYIIGACQLPSGDALTLEMAPPDETIKGPDGRIYVSMTYALAATQPPSGDALREAFDLPPRVVVGKNGAYWRDYTDDPEHPGYSMVPVSTDNDPVEPIAPYYQLVRPEDWFPEAEQAAFDRLASQPPSGDAPARSWRDASPDEWDAASRAVSACRFIAGPESFTCIVHWRPRLALTDTACIGVTRRRAARTASQPPSGDAPDPTGCTVFDWCYEPDGHDGPHKPLRSGDAPDLTALERSREWSLGFHAAMAAVRDGDEDARRSVNWPGDAPDLREAPYGPREDNALARLLDDLAPITTQTPGAANATEWQAREAWRLRLLALAASAPSSPATPEPLDGDPFSIGYSKGLNDAMAQMPVQPTPAPLDVEVQG